MKISGPKGPAPTHPAAEPAKKESTPVEGPSFREVLHGDADRVASGDPVAEVTAKLKAGEVNGDQALEMLIEAIVRQQVGEAAPALRERLRAVVRETIAADPVLSEKVRQLGEEGDE